MAKKKKKGKRENSGSEEEARVSQKNGSGSQARTLVKLHRRRFKARRE